MKACSVAQALVRCQQPLTRKICAEIGARNKPVCFLAPGNISGSVLINLIVRHCLHIFGEYRSKNKDALPFRAGQVALCPFVFCCRCLQLV
jgi:hypothetical protein